ATGQNGERYRRTRPISIAYPSFLPWKYLKNVCFSIPATFRVKRQRACGESQITDVTVNSATTRRTGIVAYTTTTSIRRLKILRRNSYRFSPRRMAATNSGLIDNNARIGLREPENRFEL